MSKTEWKEYKLGDFAVFNPTEHLSKGSIAKKIAMDKLIPYCRNISNFELEAFSGGTKFRNGDTIMARITPCLENGKISQVRILDEDEIGFGSTEYIVFRAKEGVSDPDFLYYLVTSDIVKEPAIKSMVGSSGRQRVQTDVVQNLKIKVPPLAEQQRIAKILSSLDDKIDLNNAINRNLEEQVKTLYTKLFVKERNGKEGLLGKLISIKYGKDHKKLSDGQYPVYGSGGIMRYVDQFLYDQESVLIPRKGSLNNVMYVNEPFWSVDTMFYTEMKRPNIAKYIFIFLSNQNLESLNAGSAVPSMTTDILNAMKILIPNDDVLSEFENFAAPIYRKITDNTKENKELASIRDSLLPRLMSGELSR